MSTTPEQFARAALARVWPDSASKLTQLQGGSGATVFRVFGGPKPAVVKVWRAESQDKAIRQADRQIAVSEAMTDADNRAAKVLLWDPEFSVLVMEDAGATTLQDLARNDPLPALHRAGLWITAFHATTLRPHPFRPAGHVNHLRRLVEQGDTGQRQIPLFPQFREAALRIADTGMALRGRPSHRCITHRDLTMSNLIASPDGAVVGIDFENDREDETLRDIYALAMDCVPLAPELDSHRLFQAVSGDYGPSLTDKDVRLFLQRALSLGYWARTSAEPSQRQSKILSVAIWMLRQNQPFI